MPTGPPISYPECSDWACDDDEDWAVVQADEEEYLAVKREHQIVYRHDPIGAWRERLAAERKRLAGGDPLWWGAPPNQSTKTKEQS